MANLFDELSKLSAADLSARLVPGLASQLTTRSTSDLNPAQWTYACLGGYIKTFEAALDPDHEIGARLVSFGQAVEFHIENVGYHGPHMIAFHGTNVNGERVQLIQHVSQLSVLLVAMKKVGPSARRIGFIWDEPSDKREDDQTPPA
jgi:hypothetical protein